MSNIYLASLTCRPKSYFHHLFSRILHQSTNYFRLKKNILKKIIGKQLGRPLLSLVFGRTMSKVTKFTFSYLILKCQQLKKTVWRKNYKSWLKKSTKKTAKKTIITIATTANVRIVRESDVYLQYTIIFREFKILKFKVFKIPLSNKSQPCWRISY